MTQPLTPHEFQELDALFQRAVDLPDSARAELIDEVRRRSADLADRLAAMLQVDEQESDIVDSAVSALSQQLAETQDPLIGQRFGAFRVDALLGRGGMGAVYLGTRVLGQFRQVAAIKTIRYGLQSPELIARFHRERQILAQMSHPGIARLLDGGTGPGGLPFVAMEYVNGVPLTDYVTARRCDLRTRLKLFVEMCDIIAFVHRNLIVHRDLKPANVMVTPEGRIKLLDFGIARLTDEFGVGGTATATQMRAMTPEYASPEQILGKTVTTSTDIYALGVLLFELLTGGRPIRFNTQSPYALAQAIVEHAPTLPSDYVSRAGLDGDGIPQGPGLHPRQLRGDLDRITMMALRKEVERRYASAAALGDDVRRYLAGRPVQAQVDSWQYRLRKFVQRHPLPTAAAVVALAAILGFVLLTQRKNRLIAEERDRAVEAESRTAAGANFLEGLFSVADPRNGGNRNASALDMLRAGITRLDTDDGLDPSVRANMYLTVGLALCNLEEFDVGIPAMRKSVALHEKTSGRQSMATAEALHRLGDVLRRVDRYDEASASLSEALEIRQQLTSGDSYEIADSYNNLAILAIVMGQYRKSEELQAASIEMHTRLAGPDGVTLATPLNNMAMLKRRQGKISESLELSRRAYQIATQSTDRSTALLAWEDTALAMQLEGRLDEARSILEQVLSEQTRLLGETHTRCLSTMRYLASLETEMGRYDAAADRLAQTERVTLESQGERSTSYARWLRVRAELDRHVGDLQGAEARARLAAEIHEERTGPRHYRMPELRLTHGRILTDLGRYAEAEKELQQALAQLPGADDYPYVVRAEVLNALARVWRSEGRSDDAARALEESRVVIDATVGSESIANGAWWLDTASLDHVRGNNASAAEALERAAGILESRLSKRDPLLVALRKERARVGE